MNACGGGGRRAEGREVGKEEWEGEVEWEGEEWGRGMGEEGEEEEEK